MTLVPIEDLPIWTFRPNWSGGVTERLEWLTDVLPSRVGAEQRRGLRLSPRRSLEFQLLLHGEERTFFDLMLQALGSSDWLLPLWHDAGRLTADVAIGATTLMLDTTDREFAAGGWLFIQGASAFDGERVQIDMVADDSVTLVSATTGAWATGTRVFPAQRARLADQPSGDGPTSRVYSGGVRLSLVGPNDWPADIADTYLGEFLLNQKPDYSESLSRSFSRMLGRLDNDMGVPELTDFAQRGLSGQEHRWFLKGRAAKATFRSFLYALQGRLKPIWTPTFSDDLTLAEVATAGDTEILIKRVGYTFSGGPKPGREYIRIETAGAPFHCKVTATDAAGALELLTLDTPLPADLSPQTVNRICFIEICRLDQDSVEITHVTDTDGLARASATFKALPNIRIEDTDNVVPIPTATMGSGGCPGCVDWTLNLDLTAALNYDGDALAAWAVGDFPGLIDDAGATVIRSQLVDGSLGTVSGSSVSSIIPVTMPSNYPAGSKFKVWVKVRGGPDKSANDLRWLNTSSLELHVLTDDLAFPYSPPVGASSDRFVQIGNVINLQVDDGGSHLVEYTINGVGESASTLEPGQSVFLHLLVALDTYAPYADPRYLDIESVTLTDNCFADLGWSQEVALTDLLVASSGGVPGTPIGATPDTGVPWISAGKVLTRDVGTADTNVAADDWSGLVYYPLTVPGDYAAGEGFKIIMDMEFVGPVAGGSEPLVCLVRAFNADMSVVYEGRITAENDWTESIVGTSVQTVKYISGVGSDGSTFRAGDEMFIEFGLYSLYTTHLENHAEITSIVLSERGSW